VLHHRDLVRQAVERRFIELAFAVGLLGLRFRAIEVAHHSAIATMSPELILASDSWARRDHIVRLTIVVSL
jgi:hypothetical protein